MRILFDPQIFSIQSRGGISRYIVELATQLSQRGEVELSVYAGLHRSLALKEISAPWVHGWFTRLPPKTRPLREALNRILTRRYAHRWRPNLVHETYFQTHRNSPVGARVVVTFYDLIYFVLSEPPAADRARIRRAQQAAAARADHVICISETTRRDLLRMLPIAPDRVSVVPLGCPAPKAVPPPVNTISPVDGRFILHVGLRNSYKNFDVLLRAFAGEEQLRSKFRLVAFGDSPFSRDELARVAALGLDPARVLYRAGDDATLEHYYKHATAYVCPSLYEGFGLPPLEAMACGCPAICSNRGSLPEVVGQAALLFEPTDAGALARALRNVVDSPVLATELRAKGLQQVARYSWARCADETLAVYRRLLQSSVPQQPDLSSD